MYCQTFGDEGCKYLANIRANNLESITLVANNIEVNGCLALTKANWPKISKIDLGDYV